MALAATSAHAIGQYRRWTKGKTYTCTDMGGGVAVTIDGQDVEFALLPADAKYTLHYVQNGIDESVGPFTVEQTSGVHAYAPFGVDFPSYPLTFDFRIETIIEDTVVYRSTLAIACTADGSGEAVVVDEDLSIDARYRRWVSPKTYTCTTDAGGVYAKIPDQNVEFLNLPADAEFTINYVLNGVEESNGPYPVEQTSGALPYASFSQVFPSYPFTFEFRIDTLIDGIVVYQSALDLSCSGDGGPIEVTATDGPPPTTTSTSTSTVPTTTTTSTTLPPGCPTGATFASIACRLGDLARAVTASTEAGRLRDVLSKRVTQAQESVQAADGASTPKARKRGLGRAGKVLRKLGAKLRKAEAQLAAGAAEALLTSVDSLRDDVKVLRSAE